MAPSLHGSEPGPNGSLVFTNSSRRGKPGEIRNENSGVAAVKSCRYDHMPAEATGMTGGSEQLAEQNRHRGPRIIMSVEYDTSSPFM